MKDPHEGFRKVLEKAVRDILTNPEASTSEKLKAVEQGSELLALRLKFDPSKDSGGFMPGD
jgi:hypothetical protein